MKYVPGGDPDYNRQFGGQDPLEVDAETGLPVAAANAAVQCNKL